MVEAQDYTPTRVETESQTLESGKPGGAPEVAFEVAPVEYYSMALSAGPSKSTPHNYTCKTVVQVHRVLVVAIVDTGAVRTMLSHAVYLQMQDLLGPLSPTDVVLLSASDNQCKILGEVDLPFTMKGHPYEQTALVADMGPIQLLLGLDFLYG